MSIAQHEVLGMSGHRTPETTSFGSLVDQIYRTASEDHDWQSLIGGVADFVGARSGMLGISDVTTGVGDPSVHLHELDEDLVAGRWLNEFGFEDVWASQGYAPSEGEVITGAQLLRPEALRARPLYRAVLEPLQIDDCLVTSLHTSGSRVMYLSLYQSRSHGAFGRSHRDRLGLLAPHLVRATHLEMLLDRVETRENVSRAALDESDLAVFSVDRLATEPLNERARMALASDDALVLRGNRLRAKHPASQELLERSFAAAGAGRIVPEIPVATPFPIHRGAGRLPLTCWIVPVSRNSELGLTRIATRGSAVLFIGDPEWRSELSSEMIVRLFGLTPAEARLAVAIAAGETLREYASRTGISDNTARWTLKNVQSKLGARRQVDVVSLLLRAVPSAGRRA